MPETDEPCALCRRTGTALTVHHLIPRSQHRRDRIRRRFGIEACRQHRIRLCPPCHKQVHAVLDERTLANHYHTLEALGSHPAIARFVAWIARRPAGTRVPVRGTGHRRGRGG